MPFGRYAMNKTEYGDSLMSFRRCDFLELVDEKLVLIVDETAQGLELLRLLDEVLVCKCLVTPERGKLLLGGLEFILLTVNVRQHLSECCP